MHMVICLSMWPCVKLATCPGFIGSSTHKNLSEGKAVIENGWMGPFSVNPRDGGDVVKNPSRSAVVILPIWVCTSGVNVNAIFKGT